MSAGSRFEEFDCVRLFYNNYSTDCLVEPCMQYYMTNSLDAPSGHSCVSFDSIKYVLETNQIK